MKQLCYFSFLNQTEIIFFNKKLPEDKAKHNRRDFIRLTASGALGMLALISLYSKTTALVSARDPKSFGLASSYIP
jgi:hypothetical protein